MLENGEAPAHVNQAPYGTAIANSTRRQEDTELGVTGTILPEVDDFGLPLKKPRIRQYEQQETDDEEEVEWHEAGQTIDDVKKPDRTSRAITQEPKVADQQDGHKNSPSRVIETTGSQAIMSSTGASEPVEDKQQQAVTPQVRHSTDGHKRIGSRQGASEWSHQQLAPQPEQEIKNGDGDDNDGDGWQQMPAFAQYDIYDDDGKLIAREAAVVDEEQAAYGNLGGAGKGYTRVQADEDAQSATSLDENTAYLFENKEGKSTIDDDEEERDVLSQMQVAKDLLTEGQRIAYAGLVRLSMAQMVNEVECYERTKGAKKTLDSAVDEISMWSQKMMVRLYSHLDINAAEQIMIEQLADHGVEPGDLTPMLMQNSRVKNPAAEEPEPKSPHLPLAPLDKRFSSSNLSLTDSSDIPPTPPPPPYDERAPSEYLSVKSPSQLPKTKNLDIDLRWTALCDLFLVLIADSIYDARSRTLLERVGKALSVDWLEICRFEKRITDSLEMQEAANKENWNEDEHVEERKKAAKTRRLVMMGLATVGGGLVIGLSAGLLAPVIGAGLAAGFTTIGVAGTSTFLAGAGGAAIVTSTGILTGGTIAVRATNRRMGAVKTYEYRPLHNNKRVNLIVTVAGWMTGKVDDVRLPFSTVDPIMGDIYSIHWEPEMLQSMGDTINILATEALTQGLQQILGSTLLIALMAAIQLPVVLTKLSYLIDNPWSVSQARADMAGLILADSLIDRNLGVRPVTLVGFSLGSRVIFSCLRELAAKGQFGLVQNVYLFGSPVVVKKDEYLRARAVVSGRFVNGYATNDWILGYLFRATSGGVMRVAGLAPVEIPGIENTNVTELVPGHMAYRGAMPKLLRHVGWAVESDEFTEIEDPDPENHEKRQRELINEIEEARKQLEKKPEKKGIRGWLSKNKKLTEKKDWEMYDDRAKADSTVQGNGTAGREGSDGVLFDIDAIRKEAFGLAAHGIEIKEIKGTMPPMKLSLQSSLGPPPDGSRLNSLETNLRQTQSCDNRDASHTHMTASSTSLPNGSHEKLQQPQVRNNHDYDERDTRNPQAAVPNRDKISLSFDTPNRHLATSPCPSPPYRPSPAPSIHSPAPLTFTTLQQRQESWTTPLRTPTKSALSSPAPNMDLEHNAWADEDEHEREKELEMTFE
ncbi:hypothetical protein LTR66_001663 [Elasticomyces elasticus]|nr:hypothetical protein LTR50_002474 [Elasticomyces elasticus]KAK4999267.1 hypothetical protein LTR66_001663 [Elasticomyces elasticus]